MSFGITVNNDSNHTLTFTKNTLARRNEANVSVTVTVPAAVYALGSFAYVDFLLPDGTAYYKGDYDPSSGSFTFTLGSADVILQQDGKIGIQFVLRDAAVNPTVVWKSELKYALVGASADATAQALTGIPAPATFPVTFPAANTSITDAGTYFASPDVEDALQEVGASLATNAGNITNLAGVGRTTETVKANADAIAVDVANLASGWIPVSDTWTYASANTITVPSGAASKYQKGDRIKFTQTTVKYGVIIAVADTLLTILVNTDYVVANAAITAVSYSHQQNPIGYPTWFNVAAPTWDTTTIDNGSGGQPTTTKHRVSIDGCTLRGYILGSGTKAGTGWYIGFTNPYGVTPEFDYCIGSSNVGWSSNDHLGMCVYTSTKIYLSGDSTLTITDNQAITAMSASFAFQF